MSTVQRTRPGVQRNITDEEPPPPQPSPYDPSPDDWAWLCSLAHTPEPPAELTVSLAVWLESEVASHRERSREDGDYHDMIAGELRDVLLVVRDLRIDSARRLTSHPGTQYRGLDLDAVAMPGARETHPADLLDEQAQSYLSRGGDPARLAAALILRLADQVEATGARTLRDYWDAEAALIEAMSTVADEESAYPGPLW